MGPALTRKSLLEMLLDFLCGPLLPLGGRVLLFHKYKYLLGFNGLRMDSCVEFPTDFRKQIKKSCYYAFIQYAWYRAPAGCASLQTSHLPKDESGDPCWSPELGGAQGRAG